MGENEKAFWSKVVFNGEQGAQAAAFFYLKKMLEAGHLKDSSYLNLPLGNYPAGVKNYSLYDNGRFTLDNYKRAKSIGCPKEFPDAPKSDEWESEVIKHKHAEGLKSGRRSMFPAATVSE